MPDATYALRHAFTSRCTGNYSGRDHVIIASGRLTGRRKREPGDALCKPTAKFWGLERGSDLAEPELRRRNMCSTCLEVATRLGLDLDALSHDTNVAT